MTPVQIIALIVCIYVLGVALTAFFMQPKLEGDKLFAISIFWFVFIPSKLVRGLKGLQEDARDGKL
jgi:hypothetical protein